MDQWFDGAKAEQAAFISRSVEQACQNKVWFALLLSLSRMNRYWALHNSKAALADWLRLMNVFDNCRLSCMEKRRLGLTTLVHFG